MRPKIHYTPYTLLLLILFLFSLSPSALAEPYLGYKRSFWTWHLQVMPPKNIEISATCRGIGKNLYVFVRDADWEKPVTQEDVDKIIQVFDHSTPRDPKRGIYQIATEAFGEPPDKDKDPKVYILISELGQYHGHHFDGFFRYVDQTEEEYSNRLDSLYLDAHNPSSEYHLGVLAHEFQHLIHWRYDPEEENWVNETLSEVCMILCGYYTDKRHVARYLKNTDRPLVTTAHGGTDYGACLLWGTYLYERLGLGFLGAWVKDTAKGIQGFHSSLKALGQGGRFNDYFGDWMAALFLNDPRVYDGLYRFRSVTLPSPPSYQSFSSYPLKKEDSVKGYGIDYLKFNLRMLHTDRLRVTLRADSPEFFVKVMKINKEDPSLTEIQGIHSAKIDLEIDNRRKLYQEVVLGITVLDVTDAPIKYHFTASEVADNEVVKTAIVAGSRLGPGK